MDLARNIQVIQRFYGAGPADADKERVPFFADDADWHVPGRNSVSGRYDGLAAITGEIGERMAVLDDWQLEPVEVMGNDDYVMGTVRIVARRGGRRLETVGGHLFRMTDEGRIAEAWGFVRDQAALDELLSR